MLPFAARRPASLAALAAAVLALVATSSSCAETLEDPDRTRPDAGSSWPALLATPDCRDCAEARCFRPMALCERDPECREQIAAALGSEACGTADAGPRVGTATDFTACISRWCAPECPLRDAVRAECLSNPYGLCGGPALACTCDVCACEVVRCLHEPGCSDIMRCVLETGCWRVNMLECYQPRTCQAVIDAVGSFALPNQAAHAQGFCMNTTGCAPLELCP